jgi:threonine dehydrogenase-like Zn-dependent dehydrogenase
LTLLCTLKEKREIQRALHNFYNVLFVFNCVITAVDVAGEVVSVGPGVNDLTTGDKVVSMLGLRVSGHIFLCTRNTLMLMDASHSFEFSLLLFGCLSKTFISRSMDST